MRRDVRAPADPQDFETTMSRPPTPPRDFTVKADGDNLVIELLEVLATRNRAANVGYRIVYIPSTLVSNYTITPGSLPALSDLGDTVAYIPALNDGGRQRIIVASRSLDRGWYLACPVGQRGVIGPASGAVRGPWGIG